MAARADARGKLERLCRTISRPALSQARLSLTAGGHVRYALKTPYSEGNTHVLFEPLDFIARLAAPVPKPRVNLTAFHGVFAPNSANRAQLTKTGRGKGATGQVAAQTEERIPAERRASMTWAQRLKRVFPIDIETCSVCGGAMRTVACIDDASVIEKTLAPARGHRDPDGVGPRAQPILGSGLELCAQCAATDACRYPLSADAGSGRLR